VSSETAFLGDLSGRLASRPGKIKSCRAPEEFWREKSSEPQKPKAFMKYAG
jgi:hypothetical protein